MGIGFTIGRALGKAAKAAFVPSKHVDHLPKPSFWDVKGRAIHNAVKSMHDPRLEGWYPKLESAKTTKELVREGIQELPHDKDVSASYVKSLIHGATSKRDIWTIRDYIKSAGASNLDIHTKTQLWMECSEKLHYLTTLIDFIGG